MKRLSKEQILLLHSQLIQQTGGSEGVRDYALLIKWNRTVLYTERAI